jgi:hypothetical protein
MVLDYSSPLAIDLVVLVYGLLRSLELLTLSGPCGGDDLPILVPEVNLVVVRRLPLRQDRRLLLRRVVFHHAFQ